MDNQKLLYAIIESAIDGIITMDDQGIIETMNPAALRLFGYQPDELNGQNISTLIPDPDKGRNKDYMYYYQQMGAKQGIGVHREVLGLRKDGKTFPFKLGVSEVKYENRKIFTSFIHDLSREKAAEERLKNNNTNFESMVKGRTESLHHLIGELERAGDEASSSLEKEKGLNLLKTRFLSMASHEFRTPLSSIQLSVALVEKYLQHGDAENIVRHTAKIKRSIKQLIGILNDFLSLEKLEDGKMSANLKEFDLVLFSKQIIEEMQLLAKPAQQITYQHIGALSIVRLDEALLENSIINLITNAIKYSGERSCIEVSTELTETESCITIKDNGIGIPLEDQKNLFKPFFRANNTGNIPGTGLGLNIVKRYVELMGGVVFYKSTEHVGTTVRLIFKL